MDKRETIQQLLYTIQLASWKQYLISRAAYALTALNKRRAMSLLRGGNCANCRYLTLFPKSWEMDWGQAHAEMHCALKTDLKGKPTTGSRMRYMEGCKHYWK